MASTSRLNLRSLLARIWPNLRMYGKAYVPWCTRSCMCAGEFQDQLRVGRRVLVVTMPPVATQAKTDVTTFKQSISSTQGVKCTEIRWRFSKSGRMLSICEPPKYSAAQVWPPRYVHFLARSPKNLVDSWSRNQKAGSLCDVDDTPPGSTSRFLHYTVKQGRLLWNFLPVLVCWASPLLVVFRLRSLFCPSLYQRHLPLYSGYIRQTHFPGTSKLFTALDHPHTPIVTLQNVCRPSYLTLKTTCMKFVQSWLFGLPWALHDYTGSSKTRTFPIHDTRFHQWIDSPFSRFYLKLSRSSYLRWSRSDRGTPFEGPSFPLLSVLTPVWTAKKPTAVSLRFCIHLRNPVLLARSRHRESAVQIRTGR